MSPVRIDLELVIDRCVEDVFAVWASAEAFATWFAPMSVEPPIVSMRFEVGGEYSVEMQPEHGVIFTTKGTFREIEDNRKITMTWRCDAFPDPETTVTVHFEKIADRTKIRLIHEQFETPETCTNHSHGWQLCLAALQQLFKADE